MIAILLLGAWIALAIFVLRLLVVALTTRRVEVRGSTFERGEQPGRYWAYVALNLIAAALVVGFAITQSLWFVSQFKGS
jgi:hypothetical protein